MVEIIEVLDIFATFCLLKTVAKIMKPRYNMKIFGIIYYIMCSKYHYID